MTVQEYKDKVRQFLNENKSILKITAIEKKTTCARNALTKFMRGEQSLTIRECAEVMRAVGQVALVAQGLAYTDKELKELRW